MSRTIKERALLSFGRARGVGRLKRKIQRSNRRRQDEQQRAGAEVDAAKKLRNFARFWW